MTPRGNGSVNQMPIDKPFDIRLFLTKAGGVVRKFKAGEAIFRQGEMADTIYFLQSGSVRESVSSAFGKTATIRVLEPEYFFGLGSLKGESQQRHSTMQAITESEVVTISKQAMLAALREPDFQQLFMAFLLNHASKVEAEKMSLLFNSQEKRLTNLLLLLAHVDDGNTPDIISPDITQVMLADMIGATRPRVNYFLNLFRKLGFIEYNASGGIRVHPKLNASRQTENDGDGN